MSCPIEGHPWNDGKLDIKIVIRGKKRARRLHDAKSPRCERILTFIEMQLQFLSSANRQEYAFAVSISFLNQRPDIHFVRQGII